MNAGLLIPITLFTLPFIFVIVIVWTKSKENRRRDALRADLYAKAIEKGVTLPEDLLAAPKTKNNSLRTGILMIFIGLGIGLFMYLASPGALQLKGAAAGLIPLFIGLGFLLIHFINKKQGIEDEE